MKRAAPILAVCFVLAFVRRWRTFSAEYERARSMRNPMCRP